MSSSKPKRNRPCDWCRSRKSRCNGFDVPGGRCATCITHSVECTYNDPPLPRNPSRPADRPPQRAKSKTYVQALETRISNLERLIQQISLPAGDGESEGDAEPRLSLGTFPPQGHSQPPDTDPLSPPFGAAHDEDDDSAYPEPDPDEISIVKDQGEARFFFGKSSLFVFAHQAFREKEHTHDLLRSMRTRKMESWEIPDWLTPMLKPPTVRFEFPEMSLMLHLVDCYFDNLGLILPLLHRPSFVHSITEGFHELDQNFGATVLLVCAIGCRYTDDPRVVHDLSDSRSCTAWSFYNQVDRRRKPPYLTHSLHEVQIYPLSALFLESYSPPETQWLVVGTGLRILQASGVHRKSFSKKQALETELWKRAFWVSVMLDRAYSTLLGRAFVLQDEDFDTDLPLIYDDEALDDSNLGSPEINTPARMWCFVAAIKLNQILAFAVRTIYSTKKSRVILGYSGKRWEKHVVAILDSALNKWADAVPDHLRWDSKAPKKSRATLIQSAFLWTQFYETQLHIHRMFALKEPPDPDLSVSSMIICRFAAKRCIAILESVRDVMIVPLHFFLLIKSPFTSIIFLLLMFSKKRGIDYSSPEFRAIEAGMEMVEQTAKRRRTSLHLQDIAVGLRRAVDGLHAGQKPTLRDWTNQEFKGVLYVDQGGILTNEERAGVAEPGMDDTHANIPLSLPLVIAGMLWDNEHESTAAQNDGHGFEGVPGTGEYRQPTQPVGFLPDDLFADPSVLFSGPSSAGFTVIGDQRTAGEAMYDYFLDDYRGMGALY